jgi:hypothetical protein
MPLTAGTREAWGQPCARKDGRDVEGRTVVEELLRIRPLVLRKLPGLTGGDDGNDPRPARGGRMRQSSSLDGALSD